MKFNWKEYKGKQLTIILHENYGFVVDPKSQEPQYEIVYKYGTLLEAFDDGILFETKREEDTLHIFVPYSEIKCVEITM
jgi:hypothetical protein